ncbi:hypothetical protein [Mycolicibacterium diernhoferi]|uniref:PIN domain-containing protein n=1 Tax=Mycolicibacterium diernhoferi TaxID=1801 RepID=A0A1Q4H9E7_9MYCO|nr:hypothetical protein [Mycolicibacterium diernhoferi]OJZ64042.1 hypothetical protein BRW64_20165 [Mycolicibacterium diernhoferi]OPE54525.1 hypothetical protein BV510_09835 [Mycolicibacterium diernhoferi]PEG55571.1 hypothetical protein CRI78_04710 [Mycolicibacterium diernhoferi]QYL20732.1 hypothetical protein K0O62_16795 [Mycolicibacterium diernhoferi]
MTDYQYLVDNNVLSTLSRDQRASEFFRSFCHIPDEVLYEARGFPDIDELRDCRYETTDAVLRQLLVVMKTVPVADTKLVDLYANRGGADPLIVACALEARSQNDDKLFGPTWVVVSDDDAVREKAAEFEIDRLSAREFSAILDAAPVLNRRNR